MPLTLSGGSLTLSVVLIAGALTYRTLYDRKRQRRAPQQGDGGGAASAVPQHTAPVALSRDAIALLVRLMACVCGCGACSRSSRLQCPHRQGA
jgi:hypothetical protein